MKTNRAGIDLIKRFEGIRLKAYRDAVGVWTIGYGHTSSAGAPQVKPGMTITAVQAEEMLVRDLAQYETAVGKALVRTPNENQFAAFVSLCYNIGPGNFRPSKAVKHFNAGNDVAAAGAFRGWTKAGGKTLPGLVTRREAEIALFRTAVTKAQPSPPQPIPAPQVQPVPPANETPPAPTPAPAKPGLSLQAVLAGIGALITALVAYLTMKG